MGNSVMSSKIYSHSVFSVVLLTVSAAIMQAFLFTKLVILSTVLINMALTTSTGKFEDINSILNDVV